MCGEASINGVEKFFAYQAILYGHIAGPLVWGRLISAAFRATAALQLDNSVVVVIACGIACRGLPWGVVVVGGERCVGPSAPAAHTIGQTSCMHSARSWAR